MKNVRHLTLKMIRPLIFLFLALFLLPNMPQTQSASPFAGIWKGALKVQETELGVVFQLSQYNGQWACTMDVPQEQVKGIPASRVEVNEQALQLDYPIIDANYAGLLSSDQQHIEGTWTQDGQHLDLYLTKHMGTDPSIGVLLPIYRDERATDYQVSKLIVG